jgi:hypothetical protein
MSDSFHKQLAIACYLSDCQINEILINPKKGIAKTKSLYNIEAGLTDSINYVITNLDKFFFKQLKFLFDFCLITHTYLCPVRVHWWFF